MHHDRLRTREQARAAVVESVEVLHDRQRLHSDTGGRTPAGAPPDRLQSITAAAA